MGLLYRPSGESNRAYDGLACRLDRRYSARSLARREYLVRTTGFVVRDEPGILSIAQEILPEEDGFRAVTHIPRGMVATITPLASIPVALDRTSRV